jgi:hypothetical protein
LAMAIRDYNRGIGVRHAPLHVQVLEARDEVSALIWRPRWSFIGSLSCGSSSSGSSKAQSQQAEWQPTQYLVQTLPHSIGSNLRPTGGIRGRIAVNRGNGTGFF